MKFAGIGSVGTMCSVALFMASDDDPIFPRVKEATASVLELHAGKSRHGNHGERVVVGRRCSASDLFLWMGLGQQWARPARSAAPHMMVRAIIDDFDAGDLRVYNRVCGWADTRSGDAAIIAGYMGASAIFDEAIAEFATEYADRTHNDRRAFVKAVRQSRTKAAVEA